MSGKAGRGADQFMVRLPAGMRSRIKAAADANKRSMNAEILATLDEKYPRPTLEKELIRLLNDLDALPVEIRDRFILRLFLDNFSLDNSAGGSVPVKIRRKD